MKRIILSGILALGTFLLQRCVNNGESKNLDSVDSAKRFNDTAMNKADSGTARNANLLLDNMTADFAVNAASGGMMEVQLGQMAREKAVSERVREFGTMMVRDHSRANEDLKSRASILHINLPAVPGEGEQKIIKELAGKSGKQFDHAYMEVMVQDHQKDIAEFKNLAEKCNNASIKEFASNTLPVLEKHLDSAQAIYGK
jgi:putative membrane protein